MDRNVAIMTHFRPNVGEYANVRVHSEVTELGRTKCGLDLTRVRTWERTTYPVDCVRCNTKIKKGI